MKYSLPVIPQAVLGVAPIDWTGLQRRYMNPGELEVLVALVRRAQRGAANRMIEIGCNDGRTAKAITREVPNIAEYIGVDVPPGYSFEKQVQRNEVPRRAGEHMLSDSRFRLFLRRNGSFDLTPEEVGPVDVIFIDGDHGHQAVVHDTVLARKVVKPGGMIIWHDYGPPTVDVKSVLDTIEQIAPMGIHHVVGTWLAFAEIPR